MPRHPDAFDMDDAADEPEDVTCRHCGADGLYWQDTYDGQGNRRPRLYEDGKPHVCRPDPRDFD